MFICTVYREMVCHAKQVVDDSKVSDHHATIPTESLMAAKWEELPTGEKDVLRMVVPRLLCALADPYAYEETVVTVTCAGYTFTGKGRNQVNPFWKESDALFRPFPGNQTNQEPAEPFARLPAPTVGEEPTLFMDAEDVEA